MESSEADVMAMTIKIRVLLLGKTGFEGRGFADWDSNAPSDVPLGEKDSRNRHVSEV